MPNPENIKIKISQGIIESGSVSHLAALLRLELNAPDNCASRCNLLFLDLEYSGERGELYTLQPVRSFLRRLHRAWPHAAFYCSLRTEFLFALGLSQLRHLLVIEWDGREFAAVRIEWPELWEFLQEGRRCIERLGTTAGLPRRTIQKRQKAFCHYFASRLQLKIQIP